MLADMLISHQFPHTKPICVFIMHKINTSWTASPQLGIEMAAEAQEWQIGLSVAINAGQEGQNDKKKRKIEREREALRFPPSYIQAQDQNKSELNPLAERGNPI